MIYLKDFPLWTAGIFYEAWNHVDTPHEYWINIVNKPVLTLYNWTEPQWIIFQVLRVGLAPCFPDSYLFLYPCIFIWPFDICIFQGSALPSQKVLSKKVPQKRSSWQCLGMTKTDPNSQVTFNHLRKYLPQYLPCDAPLTLSMPCQGAMICLSWQQIASIFMRNIYDDYLPLSVRRLALLNLPLSLAMAFKLLSPLLQLFQDVLCTQNMHFTPKAIHIHVNIGPTL